MLSRTEPFRQALLEHFPERPFTITFWDGTTLPSTDGGGPTFDVRSPRAFAYALSAPGQLGLGRAYVAGEIVPSDMDQTIAIVANWTPPAIDRKTQAKLAWAAVQAAGIQKPPPIPEAELRPAGRRHSIARDQRAVRHHYDVSNDFFAHFLDESMTYSCAVWDRGATTLEEAQLEKLDMVCRKLALEPGDYVLDVGSGWGSFARHAARKYGARVLGITLSPPQAELARQKAAEAGLADKIEFQVRDYRDLPADEFDAISSIGMVEHVGSRNIDAYMANLFSILKPGGRLLNHGIARVRHGDPEAGQFSERYVFPDGAPLHLSRVILAMERSGYVIDNVEGLHGQYERTLAEWTRRLESDLDRARELVGAERLRVWQLYLRAARNGFETRFLSTFQVRAHKPE
jgi:cyclopropane-fatty-acyl-phospholipid synthase